MTFRLCLLSWLVLVTVLVISSLPLCEANASDSSIVSVEYEMKSIHTLTRSTTHMRRSGTGQMQQVRAAKLRIEWRKEISPAESASALMRLDCPTVTFESQMESNELLISSNSHQSGKDAAGKIFNIVRGLRFFPGESSSLGPTTSAYVLLHQLSTRTDVNSAIVTDATATVSEFGGWPASVNTCDNKDTSDEQNILACCKLHVGWTNEKGEVRHTVKSLAPLGTKPIATQDIVVESSEPKFNSTHQLLLAWRHALHTLSSSTPLNEPVSVPTHLPPSRALRHEFLLAGLRRASLIERNAQPANHASRLKPSDHAPDHPALGEVVSFVEKSGWSSTSLQDILSTGVDPGMSPRTQAIVAPTDEDQVQVGALMTDVTTTFLSTMEQVKLHLRAGVGAKQIIALVCNKMVLRDMPPKVGLAIVKSLQQAALNILKETVSDQLTQYIVPPGSIGAFMEQSSSIQFKSEHDVVSKAIHQLFDANPIVAQELSEIEQQRQQDRMVQWKTKELERRSKMEQLSFLEGDAGQDASFLETEENVMPLAAKIEFPDPPKAHSPAAVLSAAHSQTSSDQEIFFGTDKYASFLSTYSAAAVRHSQKAKTSGDAIGQRLKDYLTPMLTHGIIYDASAQTQNLLHVLLHESLSNKLHEDISKSVTESLTKSLTDSISAAQVELLSVTLRTQLTREATHHLTKSLTLLLTPALSVILSRSLTRSPHHDYYCHICANPVEIEKPAEFHLDAPEGADPEKPYCLSCEHAKEHEYYLDYYASYYARYYSSYFSFYYGQLQSVACWCL